MDKNSVNVQDRKMELFLLLFYSVYSLAIIIIATCQEWNSILIGVLYLCIMSSWILFAGRYRTYDFRAKFTSIALQLTIFLYVLQQEEVQNTLSVFSISVVLLGLYGIKELLYIPMVSTFFICVIQLFRIKSVSVNATSAILALILQVINLFLLEAIVYTCTKKKAEGRNQLQEACESLRAVESRKDDFVANVSHEIRTPINTICGMSEIIMQENVPDNIKDNVRCIQMAGRKLVMTVNDILDFSELKSGQIELEEETYQIASTINDVINMAVARKNDKEIQLIIDCDANLPRVLLGDEKKIRRVIQNLVDNAIKFTEKGYVSIGIECRRESYGINLIVTIKDTGIGMTEESMETLFEGFYQVDGSRRRQEGGLGLGLAISRALVQRMGGTLTVKSQLGKGSIVKFAVPQKVIEEIPLAVIQNREQINVASCINLEKMGLIAIRDEYSRSIVRMMEQLRIKYSICRNMEDLKRRDAEENFTHIFLSILEYKESKAYFDKLSENRKIAVILEHGNEKDITNSKIIKIYLPFYTLTIAAVLNESCVGQKNGVIGEIEQFTTKDAHVLVVDDNRMNVRMVTELLEHYQIKVTVAHSGKEALEKITSQDYDFVFMDHMMPEMDGVETLQYIRQKTGEYYRTVPIVALTANTVEKTREAMLAVGFNDYLEKPIERSVLERVLKRNLPSEKIVIQKRNNSVVSEVRGSKEQTGNVEQTTACDSEEKWIALCENQGMDTAKGIVYCGGQKTYVKILKGYCQDYEQNVARLEQLWADKDWKNYMIEVHGLKSAMKTVGAMEISEQAKGLEFAAKENRIDYILQHHRRLIEEYTRLFGQLKEVGMPQVCQNEQHSQVDVIQRELKVMEEAAFAGLMEEMENAMYDLDSNRLSEIVSELQNYQYLDSPMLKLAEQAQRKIDMSDYVSAVELVATWKRKMEGK